MNSERRIASLVAFIAANIGQLFVGLIIVEGVFHLPGLGGGVFEAIRSRDRSLLNLGMLAALNRMHEFRIHFRGAIRNGLSEDELRATLTQIAVYCGIPAGVEAFRVARSVHDEMRQKEELLNFRESEE